MIVSINFCLFVIVGTGSDAISGAWCKDLLNTIRQNTPHSWADHTLQCFPPILREFFQQNTVPKEDKQQIKVITLLSI